MFRLSIVTPEKVFYDSDILSLIAPGSEGYLGVLSEHAALITALRPGKIEFRDAGGTEFVVAVSNGFLEVSNNVATILADAVESAEEIDIERAQSAYERVRRQLDLLRRGEGEADPGEAKAALERAANRIQVYKSTH